MFKINNEDTLNNFNHISHLFSSVSFVDFEHILVRWVVCTVPEIYERMFSSLTFSAHMEICFIFLEWN